MNLFKNTLIFVFGFLLLYPFEAPQALEPGALNPPKPGYQLPKIPQWKLIPNEDNLQLQVPLQQTENIAPGGRFILKKLHFVGNKSITNEQLQVIVQPFINTIISRIDLENIRQHLLEHYWKSGFLYPSVILPSQHISQGRVHFQINEGYLSEINIRGSEHLSEDYIRGRILLDSDESLQRTALLERFQLLLADPLVERVNGVIKPGSSPGEAQLDLDVTTLPRAYELYLGMDNYTPPSVGSYTGHLSGRVRNLLSWGELFQVELNGSEGMQNIGSYFSVPFTSYDTRFNLGFQTSQAEVVESGLERFKIENKFLDFNVGVNQPVFRSLSREFNLELQYAFRQTQTSVLGFPFALGEGVEPNGKAKVSVLRFIQNYLDRNAERVLSLRSSLNVGFDVFNATINPNPHPDGRYFSWQGQLRYLRKINEYGSELFFRADVQLVSESLLPQERFALGGKNTIRGYRQNELVRDEGYTLSVELRLPVRRPKENWEHQLQIIPFFDYGEAWNYHQNAKALYSCGVGLKWNWQQLDASFYWAHPLNSPEIVDQDYDVQDSGLHFQLQARLF